jgi:hypothetical protein
VLCHLRYICFVFELNKEKKRPRLVIYGYTSDNCFDSIPRNHIIPVDQEYNYITGNKLLCIFFHRLINNLCKITVTTVGLDYSFFLGRTRPDNHLIWFQTYSTLMDKHNISTLMDKHDISTLMDKHNIST